MSLRAEQAIENGLVTSNCIVREEGGSLKIEETLCLKTPKEIKWETPVDYYYKVGEWPHFVTQQEDHGTLRELWGRQKGVQQLFQTLGISPKYFVDTEGDDGELLGLAAQLQSDYQHDRFVAIHQVADKFPSQFLKLLNRPGIGLSDPIDWVRERVVYLMKKFPESLPQILQVLKDESPRVRGEAIFSLADLAPEEALQKITAENGLLEDPSPEVRKNVYWVLGRPEFSEGKRGEVAYQILMEREGKGIHDSDAQARAGAISSLGKLAPHVGKSEAVFKELTQPGVGLDSEDFGEFQAALSALPKIADPEAVIAQLTSRENIGIRDSRWSPRREASLRVLGDIGKEHPELQRSILSSLPLENWNGQADADMGQTLREAYRLLVRFRTEDSVRLLLEHGLKDQSDWNRKFVVEELETFNNIQDDGALREIIVQALTEGLSKKRGEAPRVGLTDVSPEVVSVTYSTLEKLAPGTNWVERKTAWEEANPVSESGCHQVLHQQNPPAGFWGWVQRR